MLWGKKKKVKVRKTSGKKKTVKKRKVKKKRAVKRKVVKKRKTVRRKVVKEKSVKKKAVRKTSVGSVKKLALSGAIKDLEFEIGKLSRERAGLKTRIQSTSSAIDLDRVQERELQRKVARLIEKEAKLNQRKKNLQTEIDRVADKMSKIGKIRAEMSDV